MSAVAPLALSGGATRRVGAILLRHFYLLRGSWTRAFDLMYWPLLQMVMWGFITTYLASNSSLIMRAGGLFLGAVLLWDVLVRGQFGMTLSLLEEMWSRNLANLFVSPLRPIEFAMALMGLSVARTIIGVGPAALLAIPLFHYSIFDLGLPLIGFYVLLMMFGWSSGLVISALLLRFGLAAESYAWASIFMLAPISGVYYPISILPEWMRVISWSLPSSYVFEGMRAVMIDRLFRVDLFLIGFGLNLVYIAISIALFLWAFHIARVRGRLMQTGE